MLGEILNKLVNILISVLDHFFLVLFSVFFMMILTLP